eukprot:gb/GEZN01010826.1/.p1 GENE.gb/GEZN01010826.1/~~gb/GEZN01010826.1/.p1  ORF type:complete len:388 (-),score=44.27 gb/GEZN01010826.1/:44-1174(-)
MALTGIRVLELAGLAPVPFCGMVLADFGADVVRIDRPRGNAPDNLSRGKRSIVLDLKNPQGLCVLRRLVLRADVLLDPFRPGVLEKLGLDLGALQAVNKGLIIARLTGWGQDGPYAKMAGHDINYIALSGALAAFRRTEQKPMFPANLLGDFAGGGLLCALGVLLALVERSRSGLGQTIDCAMLDGTTYLSAFLYTGLGTIFADQAGSNLLDSGAAQYEVYRTKDGKFMSVGALEPKFYQELLKGLALDKRQDLPDYSDSSKWSQLKEILQEAFLTKTRTEWEDHFRHSDACVAPILELSEAPQHPHNKARRNFVSRSESDLLEPAPAPKLSRTPGDPHSHTPLPQYGEHSAAVLQDYGFSASEIRELLPTRQSKL